MTSMAPMTVPEILTASGLTQAELSARVQWWTGQNRLFPVYSPEPDEYDSFPLLRYEIR